MGQHKKKTHMSGWWELIVYLAIATLITGAIVWALVR